MNVSGKISEGKKPHSVSIDGRKKAQISDVNEVISFDEASVVLGSSLGVISIEGEDLHILKMSVESGEVVIEGKINGLIYIDKTARRTSFFKRR